MQFFLSIAITILGFFSSSVSCLSTFRTALTHDLQLSAELGINPDLVLKNRDSFLRLLAHPNDTSIPAEFVTIPIDHDNPSIGTFQNRFWVNEAFYKPGGPVILYDAGEFNAEHIVSHLISDSSFLKSSLKEFNAIGILWEHRYYGASLPYPITNHTPPEYWKYHTSKLALEDIPYFAHSFNRTSFPDTDLTPESTPWIMLGGSYPGMRAAFARDRYPETIFAAFAGSAPVQARINMTSYYDQVYRGMVAAGYGNCAKDLHAALEYIDAQLDNEDTAITIKHLFLGPGAEKNSNEHFTVALGGIYGYFQAFGMGGGEAGLSELCGHLELDPATNKTAGPDGLAPIYGNQYVAERWAAWPIFTEVINYNMFTNCRGLDNTTAPSCVLDHLPPDADYISWSWQYCSEWGFLQGNNEGPNSLLSRYQTLEFQQNECYRLFPEALESGILPRKPQADAMNKEFGGWHIRPSNVYYSEGEFDPWRTLSHLSTEDYAPKGVNVSTEIPKCGVSTGQDTVFGFVGKNAYHCFDFRPGTAVGEESRGYLTQALKEWLPCFHEQKKPEA